MSQRRGMLLFAFLVTLLGSLVLYSALRLRVPRAPAPSSAVLVFDVPERLDESEPPFRPYSFEAFRVRERPVLYHVVEALDRAAADERVRSLVLHVDGLDWGWARLQEVRDALLRFRASGKPLYASLMSGGDAEYFLASAADVVAAPPTAAIGVDGLTASAVFLRGTFDKLGVSPNFRHVGEYKSAVESYTRGELSEPAREALAAVLDDEFATLVDAFATARRMPADSVRALVDRGPFTAREALAAGLLDTLLYAAETDSMAVRRAGRHAATLAFSDYLARWTRDGIGTRVALITAEGTIAPGKSRISPGEGRVVGAETLSEALREVARRKAIRAVVLRIDSPGGDAQSSDDIWREVERLRRRKPVVVSMSDYAASGGYYIAMGADRIVAEPGTLTGSIGIFGGKFNLLGLYRKLGLNVETLARGERAEMYSPFRDFSAGESEVFERHLQEFYRGFVEKVAMNRGRSYAEVDSLARGRVWSGRAAFERGLVDTLGGLDAAFALARTAAGIAPDEPLVVERFPAPERPFFRQMLETLFGDTQDDASLLASRWLEPIGMWAALAALPPGRPLALMPFLVEVR